MGEMFIPNCKIDKAKSSEGLTVWVCKPSISIDGKLYQANEEIRIFSDGKHKSLENDGGLPEQGIKKLMDWISKHG